MLTLALVLFACKPDATDLPDHVLMGISVTPVDALVGKDDAVQFVAKAWYEDYTSAVISDQVTWESTDARVVSVDNSGLARGLEEGAASLVVTLDEEHTTRVEVRVTGAAVAQIAVEPAAVEVRAGDRVTLAAVAHFSDGTTGNVAGSCTWASDTPAVATVDSTGAVDALRPGEAVITATYSGVEIAPVSVVVVEEDAEIALPDLRVTTFDGVVVDGTALYEVEVHNQGQGIAGGFYLDLISNSEATPVVGSYDLDGLEWVSSLAGGARIRTSIEVEGVVPGEYRSWVYVDPENWVEEADERNNIGGPFALEAVADAAPDLQVQLFEALTDGLDTAYWIEVVNAGNAPAPAFWVDVFTDQEDAPEVGDYGSAYANLDPLAPGEVAAVEFELPGGPGEERWTSWLLVDSQGSVDEADESNNVESIDVEIW